MLMPKFQPEVLKQLWEHLSQESQRPDLLLEEWVGEVVEWVRLRDYQEKLRQEESLWLPTGNKAELAVLLGLGALSTALDCSPTQLVQALLEPPVSVTEVETEPPLYTALVSPDSSNIVPTEPTEVRVSVTSDTAHPVPDTQAQASLTLAKPELERYTLLLEALTDFQAVFELAVEQVGTQLEPQTILVHELEDYLAELFDVVRAVLTQEQTNHEQ